MKDNLPKAYEPNNIEKHWNNIWLNSDFYKGKIDNSKTPYSIVIPPPNVTGILTLGHVLNNTLQDILVRWKRMKGYSACWFPGTDHAGIATESKVAMALQNEEGINKHELGRDEFIDKVWDWKKQYGGTIIKQLKTLGCSCDWDRERFTLDEGLSDAVQKVFIDLYNKGYIYKGTRMINWCPISRTALSDEEVIHRESNGNLYHFKYPYADGSGHIEIATTRPETMLGDTAIAVNPNDERYKDKIGKMISLPLTDREIPLVTDDHADPKFGTGCVKITPAHDPNDFEVGKRHDLPLINVMNPDATMSEAAGKDFAGLDRFDCRKKVVSQMEELGLVVKIEPHIHNVGYSERGNVPIEPRVSDQWFVKMKELAEPAINVVKDKEIKFYPERWEKVYYNWLNNIQDWCISRQIWWGHRIPAWYNDATGETYVGADNPNETKDGTWRQEEDVLDTWFSSWLWPFSIMGWPNETPEQDYFYTTDDLVTGPDIIFFWVARMIMAGLEFKKSIPFKNVYFTSIIRDEQGRKLSKSLGNSPDPLEVIDTYGADALRFSIIYIAPVGIDIRYSNDKCVIGRNFANKLWNACRFRQMHGDLTSGYKDLSTIDISKLTSDQKWILAELDKTIKNVNSSLENFSFQIATQELYQFIWSQFCDWFIETSKGGIFAGGEEKEQALTVLDYVLYNILKLLHPFMPFITEELSHKMGFIAEDKTIMYSEYPESVSIDGFEVDNNLVEMMNANFDLIRAGRSLRASYNIAPSLKLQYNIKADEEFAKFLSATTALSNKMLNGEINITNDVNCDGPAPAVVTEKATISLPLKGVIDIEAELNKLEKQKKELEGWIKGSQAKLSNERFLSNAPEKVVADAKAHLEDMKTRLVAVNEMLESLK